VNYVIDSMRVDHAEQSNSQDGSELCTEDVEGVRGRSSAG
jgi:hypothetical protein